VIYEILSKINKYSITSGKKWLFRTPSSLSCHKFSKEQIPLMRDVICEWYLCKMRSQGWFVPPHHKILQFANVYEKKKKQKNPSWNFSGCLTIFGYYISLINFFFKKNISRPLKAKQTINVTEQQFRIDGKERISEVYLKKSFQWAFFKIISTKWRK